MDKNQGDDDSDGGEPSPAGRREKKSFPIEPDDYFLAQGPRVLGHLALGAMGLSASDLVRQITMGTE